MDEPDQPRASSRRAFLKGAAGAAVGMGVLGAAAAGPAGAETPPHQTGITGFSGVTTATSGPGSSPHPTPHPPLPAHPHYNRHRFEGARGARMTVNLPDGPVSLTISDILPLGVAEGAAAGSAVWRDAFRVLLKGPAGTDIPQGTHSVSINGRTFDLFVVPVMSTANGRRYEAIIHRAYHRRAHV